MVQASATLPAESWLLTIIVAKTASVEEQQ
jgi:hypothetical protein